ncbi:MAG: type II secretion system protein [Phycisphaerales bacterium]
MRHPEACRPAFSLIELIIVLVILGAIVAIALPRLSHGVGCSAESALRADLVVLRQAIDLYAMEHGGAYPTDAASFVAQMTQYTDDSGNARASRDATHIYGPYLAAMPAVPIKPKNGSRTVRGSGSVGTGAEGWYYYKDSGKIIVNAPPAVTDCEGVAFVDY